jgi:hypothetical protein
MDSAILLAQVSSSGELPGSEFTRSHSIFSDDHGALIAIVLILVAALFVGVKVWFSIRARKRRRRSRNHHRRETTRRETGSGAADSRRKRRQSKSRNPTLAETGGLPPPRPEGQAPRHLEP